MDEHTNAHINKYRNVQKGKYRSRLEAYVAKRLREENIPFVYEKLRIELIEPFEHTALYYGRVKRAGKKSFALKSSKVRASTYLADFSNTDSLDGLDWIIEVKGYFTAEAKIKWKLLLKYFKLRRITLLLLMPTNQREVEICIDLIKKYTANANYNLHNN